MKKIEFSGYDIECIEKLGLNKDIVEKAYNLGYYDDGAYNFDFWSERNKFYVTELDIRGKRKEVNVRELGSNKNLKENKFDTSQKALEYYIDSLENKNMITFFMYFKITMYYILDFLVRIFAIPFLLIFQFKDTKDFLKDKGLVNTLKRIFLKTWIDYGWFNEYRYLLILLPIMFVLGAIIF